MVAALVQGRAEGPLAADAAIAACAAHPIPLVSAVASATAARRAARLGCGVLFDSLSTPERCRALADAYRSAGGTGPVVLVRRAWLGDPPTSDVDRQVGVYRGYAPQGATSHWGADEMVASRNAGDVAARLAGAMDAAGADALNVRCHVPGVSTGAAREQIARIGDDVVSRLRDLMTPNSR
jgi:alkanesulfonate monooxygenase SsuD/methylene tetrahydromethanopterin reductase-like flavin-dependent oxidoreductase (luciferase family)